MQNAQKESHIEHIRPIRHRRPQVEPKTRGPLLSARGLIVLGLCALGNVLVGCRALWRMDRGIPGGLPRHHTLLLLDPDLKPDSSFGETPWIDPGLAFDEVLLSWNVEVPNDSGALFGVQVRDGDGNTSPWLDMGDWGLVDAARPRVINFGGGHVDVDTLVLDFPAGESQADDAEVGASLAGKELRVRMRSVGPGAAHLSLLAITVSDRAGRFNPAPPKSRLAMPAEPIQRLQIPFRSQRAAAPSLSSRVCSPTSVSMVLAAAGIHSSIERVAALAFDPRLDLYGVWPRSIQAAYSLGLPGFLTRFEGWAAVHAVLGAGIPLVISVRAEPGELRGAPYDRTDGHLLVLSGVDDSGNLLVHDPAAADVFQGVTTYLRSDLQRCWLDKGGTAYLFVPRGTDPARIASLL